MSHNNFIQYDSYCIILHPCHLIFPPCPILFGVVFTFNALFVGVFSGSWRFNFPGWLPTTSALSNFYKYRPYYMVIDGHHWKVITAFQKDIKFVWVSPPLKRNNRFWWWLPNRLFVILRRVPPSITLFIPFWNALDFRISYLEGLDIN